MRPMVSLKYSGGKGNRYGFIETYRASIEVHSLYDSHSLLLFMATHGDSNVEAIFYSLTGINPAEVKRKGPFDYGEAFKLVIENGKMQVEFRKKKFPVLNTWKTALRKQNAKARGKIVERNILLQEERRKARVRMNPRNPKRRTMRR